MAQIILDFQKGDLPELVERKLKIDLEIPIKRAITILGPRRSGKTYYLFYLIKKLFQKGIEKQRILYINFEDPKLVNITLKDLSKLLEVFIAFIIIWIISTMPLLFFLCENFPIP